MKEVAKVVISRDLDLHWHDGSVCYVYSHEENIKYESYNSVFQMFRGLNVLHARVVCQMPGIDSSAVLKAQGSEDLLRYSLED